MTTFEKTFKLLEDTGLNWSVEKKALQTEDGQKTESFGLFRSDTGKWMGTVGDRYTVLQNSTLAETIVEAAEGIDLSVERGGQLRGGKRVYLQAELPQEHIGNSPIRRYITALNSHDGTTAIAFGSTNQVVICENTFHMAYKSGDLTKFAHYASAEQRIREAMLQMKATIAKDNALMENFKRMADTKLTEEMSEGIVARILKRSFDVELSADKASVSERKKRTLTALDASITRELKDEGVTLWGLFNGITRYTNHVAAPSGKKEEYVMTGAGYDTNLVAFDEIMSWIDQHSEPVLVNA